MSNCKICFHKDNGRVMQRPVAGACDLCNPNAVDPAEDACVCPPLGEPRFLPVIAPVVFDELGINLCREIRICDDILDDYPDAESVEIKVIDIDFNLDQEEGSDVEVLTRRPNCVRVRLSRLCVKFAVKLLDDRCRILAEKCIVAKYLPDEEDPSWDEDTNPSSVTVEMYAPYGLSYFEVCGKCKPTINFIGFVEGPDGNNTVRQGIAAQALAKVVEIDMASRCVAVGLTIYLKSVYFIQYKLKHAGLCVPPKLEALESCENACKEFVEGDLLEQSIQPLELCTVPKSFNPKVQEPVEDPTPVQEAEEDTPRRRNGFCLN